MNQLKILPTNPFSFNEYSEGYIFEPLFQVDNNTFTNSFSFVIDDKTWFINSKYSKKNSKATKDPVIVDISYFCQSNEKKFIEIEEPSGNVQELAKKRIVKFLGLEDDLSEFYKFVDEFEEISKYKDLIPGFRLSGVLSEEWLPILAYLSTNTTVDMYHTFLKNFLGEWGLQGKNITSIPPAFPPLTSISAVRDEDYRKTKVGYRAKYLPAMVQYLINNKLSFENPKIEKVQFLKQLRKIKGIGDYSGRCIILYGTKDYSMSFVDSYVKFLMKHYFNISKDLTNNSLLKLMDEKFFPFQGLLIDWLTAVYSVSQKLPNTKIFKVHKS